MAEGESFQALVQAAPCGLLVVDDAGSIRYANPCATAWLSARGEDLVGSPLPVACSPGQVTTWRTGPDRRVLELTGSACRWQGRSATLVQVLDITRLQAEQDKVASCNRLDDTITTLADHALQGASPTQLQAIAADMVCVGLRVDCSAILAYDAAAGILKQQAGGGWPQNTDRSIPLDGDAPEAQSLLEATAVHMDGNKQPTSLAHDEACLERDLIASIHVPIPRGNTLETGAWGVLCAYQSHPRTFQDHEVHFLNRVAYVLSYSMKHAHLLQREHDNHVLMHMAGRIAHIGGWQIDPAADRVIWSEETCAIHRLPAKNSVLTMAEAGKYTDPAYVESAAQRMQRLLETGEPFDDELRIIRADGQTAWVRTIGEAMYNDDCAIIGARGAVQDITEVKRAQDEIHFVATHDPLTQLPNRRLLEKRLGEAIADCRRSGSKAAVMLLDLDDFKTLNDSMGHDAGDRLLQETGRRLSALLRRGDTVARLGGDEFVLVVRGLDANGHTAAAQAERMGHAILDRLREPWQTDHTEYHGTHSIGVTLFGFANDDVVELLKQADMTLYTAKAGGRDGLRVFDPQMQKAVQARTAMETDMRAGIEKNQFEAWLQGQVDADGQLVGAEVLARWRHPAHGIVSPAEFIPLAESSGHIHVLGRIMLRKACRELVSWADQAETSRLHLAVNVSAQQFHHPAFVEDVKTILQDTGANPARLVLELTESSMLANMDDTIAKMTKLRRIGVRFSLDDFGTGYSSLYYLKHLPLAQLKIDRSFIQDVDTSQDDATIVRTILALASAMGLAVIAEGVETAAQRNFLATLRCPAYQGFLYFRPVPMSKFRASRATPV